MPSSLVYIAEAERVLNAERGPMALFTHPDGSTGGFKFRSEHPPHFVT